VFDINIGRSNLLFLLLASPVPIFYICVVAINFTFLNTTFHLSHEKKIGNGGINFKGETARRGNSTIQTKLDRTFLDGDSNFGNNRH